jgi:hypothetical protein
MKPFKSILLLTAIVSAIVLLWLVPGINTASQAKYVRIYEDTDATIAVKSDTTPSKEKLSRTSETKTPKKYKSESIEADAQLRDIKPRMFSRAIHFDETLLTEEVVISKELLKNDSISEPQISLLDSVQMAAIDTIARLQ